MTRTADTITLTGLSVYGYHGATEPERRGGQRFLVDITLSLDLAAAARTDDLAATVDYAALAARAADIVAGPAYALIETLGSRIADEALADRRVHRVEVTVHKPAAPIPLPFGDVAVTVVRDRDGAG